MGSLGGVTGRDHWAGPLVTLRVESPWDHRAGSKVTLTMGNAWSHWAGSRGGIIGIFECGNHVITGRDRWAGSLGWITGNFEGGKPMGSLGGITGREQW